MVELPCSMRRGNADRYLPFLVAAFFLSLRACFDAFAASFLVIAICFIH